MASDNQCQCGDRPASGCPGAWEQGCDLGKNEKHATVVTAPAPPWPLGVEAAQPGDEAVERALRTFLDKPHGYAIMLRDMTRMRAALKAAGLFALQADVERLRGIVDEQRLTIGALMIGCDDGTTSVLVRMSRQDATIERLRAERDGLVARVAELTEEAETLGVAADREWKRAEKAEARVAEYERLLSAEMPEDFKDWWKNSKAEWPLVAATALRMRRQRAEEAEARVAELERLLKTEELK